MKVVIEDGKEIRVSIYTSDTMQDIADQTGISVHKLIRLFESILEMALNDGSDD